MSLKASSKSQFGRALVYDHSTDGRGEELFPRQSDLAVYHCFYKTRLAQEASQMIDMFDIRNQIF